MTILEVEATLPVLIYNKFFKVNMSSLFLCIRQYIHKYSYVKWIDPANVQHKIYTLMA